MNEEVRMKNEEVKARKTAKHQAIVSSFIILHSAFPLHPHFSVFICSFGIPKPWMTSSSAKSTSAFGPQA
jgi:hypothetical protein